MATQNASVILQDLEHVGPLALANLAQLAVSTKNKPLGSAIIERLAAMPSEKKPLRAADLAKAVFDDEWQKVQEAFTIAENRFQEITVLYRSFTQQRVNPVQQVHLGLNKQKETGVLDELIQEEKGTRHV